MARPQLLLVDGDPRSLRLLEVSLRKAGFLVTSASNGREALAIAERLLPDLVLSDTHMPEMDGFEFCSRFKADPRFREVPFVFLTTRRSVEDKVRGLELGVDDYLTKPIYVKEIVTRVRMLLQKRERERLERRDPRTGFAGNLADLGIVDLVQTCEIGKKTGVLRCVDARGRRGTIYFRDGRVIDAEVGGLVGEHAFYRMIEWGEGTFELTFGPQDRPERIQLSAQGLLMEGMRRLDEWSRLAETGPSLDAVFQVDVGKLSGASVPEAATPLLPLFDGRRPLHQVLEEGARDDLAALQAVIELCRNGILVQSAAGPAEAGEGAEQPPSPAVDLSWFASPAAAEQEADPEATAGVVERIRSEATGSAQEGNGETSQVFEFPEPKDVPRWIVQREQPAGRVAARQAAAVATEPSPLATPEPAEPREAKEPQAEARPAPRLVEVERISPEHGTKRRNLLPWILLAAAILLLVLLEMR